MTGSPRGSLHLDVPRKARGRSGSYSSANSLPPPYSRSAPQSRSPSRARALRSNPSKSRSSSQGSASSYYGNFDREYLRTPLRKESVDDALEILRGYDTVIVVDDSLSMAGQSWQEARDALGTLAKMAGQYDTNGIDIHFLNTRLPGMNITNINEVQRLFAKVVPRGATPTGRRLEELLQDYISRLEAADDTGRRDSVKPVNYIVITDGEPSDDPESVIVDNAKRLDARHFPLCQVGIQFVQIGNSKRAARHLKELDDNLSSRYNIRDMVDTVPYLGRIEGDMLVKVLIGAINRKQDREPVKARPYA